MPAKKTILTDAERAKRLREAARERETGNDPADFEQAFRKIVMPSADRSRPSAKKRGS